MPYFDTVQRASFNDIDIIVDSIEIVGGIRDHIHEPPHNDGGYPEKLGRKLYLFQVGAVFDENVASYPDNYPSALLRLRKLFAASKTAKLTLPNNGTIYAYCRNFKQTWKFNVRSGERMTMEFVEDPQNFPLPFFIVPTLGAMTSQLDDFNAAAQLQQDRFAANQKNATESSPIDLGQCSFVDPSLLSNISSAYSDLLAARGRAELAGILMQQKIDAVINGCNALDSALTSPLDCGLLYAAQVLAQTARNVQQNASGTSSPIKTYLTPRTMSAAAISTVLYGDTTHAMDVLQLNPIANGYAIPGNTLIRYVDTTAGAGTIGIGSLGAPPRMLVG